MLHILGKSSRYNIIFHLETHSYLAWQTLVKSPGFKDDFLYTSKHMHNFNHVHCLSCFFCTKLRHLFFHIINTKYILRCIIKQVHCTNLRDFYYTCPTGAHSTNTSTSGSIHWTIFLKNSLISNSYLKVDPLIIETEIRIEDSMRQIMFSFEKFTYTVTLNIYTLTIFKAIKFLSEE